MLSCWVREKSWWGAVPKSVKVSSEGLGCCPEGRGQPIPPCTEMLCVNSTRSGWVFKEPIMFCLSFQVDLTTTSAAAAPGAGAAAKFLIYRSQNTWKKDFYCYTVVQRGNMQLWEVRWLMESRHPSPVPPQHPACTPLLSVGAHQLFCTFNNSKSSNSYFRHTLTTGIRKLNIIRSSVSVLPHRKEYKTPFTHFWFYCLCGSPSETQLQHWAGFCTPEGKSCKLIHFGCCLLQIKFIRLSSLWGILCRGGRVINAINDWPENTQVGAAG